MITSLREASEQHPVTPRKDTAPLATGSIIPRSSPRVPAEIESQSPPRSEDGYSFIQGQREKSSCFRWRGRGADAAIMRTAYRSPMKLGGRSFIKLQPFIDADVYIESQTHYQFHHGICWRLAGVVGSREHFIFQALQGRLARRHISIHYMQIHLG
jgi:hypothetical protein